MSQTSYSYAQYIFYHYILSDVELTMKIRPEFFDPEVLKICFKYAQEYVSKYHTAPTLAQLKELLRMDNVSDIVDDNSVDVVYSIADQVSQYTKDWLYDNTTAWAQWKNFLFSIRNMNSYIKLNQDNVTVENVKELMEHSKSIFNQSCIIEFDENNSNGSDFWDAKNHKREKMKRYGTGYPFLDSCMDGGYFPGSLTVFVGAPKIGKSLWLQNLCAKSVQHGENNAYITLELAEELVNARIGANMFNINTSEYHLVSNDDEKMKDIIQKFKKSCIVPPGALIVKQFPTSAASVLDLEAYLLQKEQELSTEGHPFKFKNIFVDYINIMRNYRNPNTENTYMKIKQIAEDLRAMGIKHGWAIITATQTNRSQYEKNDIDGTQVSESSALIATVDLMFGIIASPDMKIKNKYIIKCMYDRVARKDGFKKDYSLLPEYLRIVEDANEAYQDSEVYVPTIGKINPGVVQAEVATPAISSNGNMKPNISFSNSKTSKSINTMAQSMSMSIPLDAPTTITPPATMVRSAVNITANGLFDKK